MVKINAKALMLKSNFSLPFQAMNSQATKLIKIIKEINISAWKTTFVTRTLKNNNKIKVINTAIKENCAS